MLDIKLIRDDPEGAKQRLATRGVEPGVIDEVLKLDETWREKKTAAETRQAELNKASKAFGPWMGARKKNPDAPAPKDLTDVLGAAPADPETAKAALGKLGDDQAELQKEADAIENQIDGKLLYVPNLPAAHTPVGKSEADNVVRKTHGDQPQFDFTPKPHWDLVAGQGFDMEIGGRISGSGFPFFRGKLARLERALINFFLDLHTREHGYTECWTPFMVREETLRNSSQLPKFFDEMYRTDERDDLFMIPTAEVPLTSAHAGEILPDEQTPIRYCAFTPCFRREAGAAGKDTRGILRVHQFNKVELMVVTTPEQSEQEHEALTRCAETVLEKLELPYRRLELCTGDLGFGAARCYDLEVWAAGVGKWLEVSSCSNFTDYQARRAKIRVKNTEKKTRLAHTLNGSGLACPRTMIAILENGQTADGKVKIPVALVDYYGGAWL
jgi:seryl-tRNA synthetase